MNVPPKAPSALQTYQTIVYDRALHPELFELRGRRVVSHGDYELEAWIMDGRHLLRFDLGESSTSELVTDQEQGLPTHGVIQTFLCAGERDFDHEFKDKGVRYMTTVQTETLSEALFVATYEELAADARENRALMHEWRDEAGRCLSIVDIQRYNKEVHVQAYHLLAQGGAVLRTQSIFEHD